MDALRVKVMAPSVKRALVAKKAAQEYSEKKTKAPDTTAQSDATAGKTADPQAVRRNQAKGDRAGVKVCFHL